MSVRTDVNLFTGLDLWDATHVQIPDRSRLHHLAPIGISTPYVESLSSYISRLADTHHVTVFSLFHEEIRPYLSEDFKIAAFSLINYARAINGLDRAAKCWVTALEHLTLRKGLRFLTMLNWGGVLPSRQLVRSIRAWCPNCYQEWYATGKIVFDPLIWSIRVIEICSHHNRPLVNQCPDCGKTSPLLHNYYRAGYCSRCMRWMGRFPTENDSTDYLYSQREFEWQKWVSYNVGELLALAANCPPPNKERMVETLTALARKAPRQSTLGLADWLRIPRRCVVGWCKGETLPRLSASLYICYRLGRTLAEFLMGDNIVSEFKAYSPAVYIPYKTIRMRPPQDVNVLRIALEAALVGHEFPPPTLTTLATRLETNVKRLRRLFPELCGRISAKCRQYRRERSRKKLELACEEVRRISLELHSEGIEPTHYRIAPRMKKSAYFFQPEVVNAMNDVRRELGYERP